MIDLSLKPSESIYEIEILGSFIPGNYNPMWFFSNDLLGKEEAENATILKAEHEVVMIFTTNFIRIIVEKNKFRIGTGQLLSFDLVKDMAISVCKLIKDSILNEFSIETCLHITFKNEKLFLKALNSLGNAERWNNLLANPQSIEFEVQSKIDLPNKKLKRILRVSPCGRSDMKNTLHVYVFNVFTLKKEKTSVWEVIEEDTTTLNASITLINDLNDLHFKN